MRVDLDVHLKGTGSKTTLSLATPVDMLGKLAVLEHSIFKRKADQVMEEFAPAVKERMQGKASNA